MGIALAQIGPTFRFQSTAMSTLCLEKSQFEVKGVSVENVPCHRVSRSIGQPDAYRVRVMRDSDHT